MTASDQTVTIYIRLLDEGVDVWRPVQSRPTDVPNVFILGTVDGGVPSTETWEFPPGARVFTEEQMRDDGKKKVVALIVTRRAD